MSRLFIRNSVNFLLKAANSSRITMQNNCSASTGTSQKLKGKVAIVTASTDGIGLAIAKRLATDGASVVISSRKADNVTRAISELQAEGLTNVFGMRCHVGNRDDRHALFTETVRRFGGLDILVSNAAVNPAVGQVLDASEEAWDKIFEINVKAAFLLAKEARPLIKQRGGGSIIFVSSIAGYKPFPILGAYSVSKTTLFGLTKAAAQDLAPENIRVNCLAPGIIKTNFSKALYESDTAREIALSSVPMGRLGEPHEMASVVSFLASEDASYITGETIAATGGMLSRL